MAYMFLRGTEWVTCETCLNPDGIGFHLVVTQNGERHVERFDSVPSMLAREHEWLQAWRSHGWRELGATPPRAARRE
jgi:hypothetical protein